MPDAYLTDGEMGFIGLNSRDNPATLPQGYVSKSVNFRFDRGVATVRKGLKKYSNTNVYGATKRIVGSGAYLDANGQEIFVFLVHDTSGGGLTKLFTFNPQTAGFSAGIPLPVQITSSDGVDIVAAVDNIFISRGHGNRPLRWDKATVIEEILTNKQFPACTGLMYYQNRLIAIGKHVDTVDTARNRDTVSVSHFLQYDKWAVVDAFTINQGGNDEVVATVPWTMNEFLILCRNSTFYLNVGTSRYASGDALSNDARLESLSVDVGCAAKKSAVQVGSGVMFLSDNGVYFLQPVQSGQPDGVKLLTLSEPISAPIDDVIKTINRAHVSKAVAAYWNNRYYLAVPTGNSTVNNTVLVYNFILKAWESVDTYPQTPQVVDVMNFVVGKRDSQRRLYAIDSDQGIYLFEEGKRDELGAVTGTPILGTDSAKLPWTLSNDTYGDSKDIEAELITRRFTGNEGKDKRFSSVESDFFLPAGAFIETWAVTTNPDTETKIDSFTWIQNDEDTTRRNPVRKNAYGMQIKFLTKNYQPEIRQNYIKFTMNGKNNINSI